MTDGRLPFVIRPQAIRALTDAVTVGRFMRSAKRVINFARLVLEAVGILKLLHAKSALRKKNKVWPCFQHDPDQSTSSMRMLVRCIKSA